MIDIRRIGQRVGGHSGAVLGRGGGHGACHDRRIVHPGDMEDGLRRRRSDPVGDTVGDNHVLGFAGREALIRRVGRIQRQRIDRRDLHVHEGRDSTVIGGADADRRDEPRHVIVDHTGRQAGVVDLDIQLVGQIHIGGMRHQRGMIEEAERAILGDGCFGGAGDDGGVVGAGDREDHRRGGGDNAVADAVVDRNRRGLTLRQILIGRVGRIDRESVGRRVEGDAGRQCGGIECLVRHGSAGNGRKEFVFSLGVAGGHGTRRRHRRLQRGHDRQDATMIDVGGIRQGVDRDDRRILGRAGRDRTDHHRGIVDAVDGEDGLRRNRLGAVAHLIIHDNVEFLALRQTFIDGVGGIERQYGRCRYNLIRYRDGRNERRGINVVAPGRGAWAGLDDMRGDHVPSNKMLRCRNK